MPQQAGSYCDPTAQPQYNRILLLSAKVPFGKRVGNPTAVPFSFACTHRILPAGLAVRRKNLRPWLSLGKLPLCLSDVPLVLADPGGTF
jgi:hypothetical protein